MKTKITLALDIEGTLVSHASTMIPRPGLFEFLTFCQQNVERIPGTICASPGQSSMFDHVPIVVYTDILF